MSYTDPNTVRVALTPGGDDTDVGSAAYLGDDDLEAAIADATDEVDAKLAGRYQVPFSPVPDLIKQLTTDISCYLTTLTARRGDPLLPGDPVALRYARAESMLGQLQSGAMLIAGATGGSDANELMPVWTDTDADPLPSWGLPPAPGTLVPTLQI